MLSGQVCLPPTKMPKTGDIITTFEPEKYTVYQNVPLKFEALLNLRSSDAEWSVYVDGNLHSWGWGQIGLIYISFSKPGKHFVELFAGADNKRVEINVLSTPSGTPPEILELNCYKLRGGGSFLGLKIKGNENISRVEVYVLGNKLRTILVDNLWRKSKDINIGFPLFPEGGKYRIKAKVFDEYGRMASKEINAEIKDPYEEVKEVSIKSNAIKSLDSEIKPTLTSIFGGVKIRSSSFDYSGIYIQYITKRPVTIDDVIKLKESFPEYCFMGGSISDNRFTLTFIKHGNSNLCINGIIGFKYLDIHVS